LECPPLWGGPDADADLAEKENVDNVQEGRGCSVAEGGGRNQEEESGL